jgi:pilus assembly protein CpaE
MASGIHDYLLKPLSASQLRESLTHAQMVFSTPKAAEHSAAQSHISTAVVGTRGGVGTSTLATSLAWLFSVDHNLPTALLDLDIHFGTGALTLDLEPGRGLTDAIDNPGRIDGLFIERAMVRANDNLAILSSEAPINTPLLTDGSAFVQLEEEFRQSFEMTVIDLPRNMLINFPDLLRNISMIVLVTELTLAAARDTIRILAWLKSSADHIDVVLVANRVQPGFQEISKADFEASIETSVDFVIPLDQKGAVQAAKLGQTFVNANGSSKTTSVIRNIAQSIVHTSHNTGGPINTAEEKGKTSLLRKFDFKGMIARKDKSAG